jgi:hypothetical protein
MRKWIQKTKPSTVYDVAAVAVVGSLAVMLLWGRPLSKEVEHFFADEREQVAPPDSASSPWQPAAAESSADSAGLQLMGWWEGFTSAVAVDSQTVYHGDWQGLEIVDFSDPGDTVQKGRIPKPGPATIEDVALSGGYAYVLINDHNPNGMPPPGSFRLQVIDVSDPAHPQVVGRFSARGEPHRLAVAGDYVYIANGGSYSDFHDIDDRRGLRILDVSDPTHPHEVSTFGWRFSDVAVSGERAYLTGEEAAGDRSGLYVLDVATPAALQKRSFFAVDDTPTGVAVAGSYVYLAVEDRRHEDDHDGINEGLRVVDVSDPKAPKQTAAFDTPGDISGVAASGKRVYITYAFHRDESERLQMIDAENPAKLRPKDTLVLDTPHSEDVVGSKVTVMDLAAAERYVCVAGWRGGMVRVKVPSK